MFKRNVEVERLRPLIIRYRRRLDFPGQVVLVTIRDFECGFDPSFGGCDGGNAANQVHGDYSLIISHRSKRLSFRKRLAFGDLECLTCAISSPLYQR